MHAAIVVYSIFRWLPVTVALAAVASLAPGCTPGYVPPTHPPAPRSPAPSPTPSPSPAPAPAPAPTPGPGPAIDPDSSSQESFSLYDGITLHVVNHGNTAFTTDIEWTTNQRDREPVPVLVRVFDPDDRQVARQESAGERINGPSQPVERATINVPASGAGVYQIIITGKSRFVSADVGLSPALPYGVAGHTQWLTGHDEQFETSYIYLPPGLEFLNLSTEGNFEHLILEDEQGNRRLDLRGREPSGRVDLPGSEGNVWRLRIKASGRYRLNFGWVPIILCRDEATARTIRGNVTVLEDGTICFFRFQERAWRLLEQYRQLPRSAFQVPLPKLNQYRDAWSQEPARNSLLLGSYGVYSNLPPVLAAQHLDPDSPWFGTFEVWRDGRGGVRPGNIYADYFRRLPPADGSGSGESVMHLAHEIGVLAAVHQLDAPFNPLHEHPALLNRIIIGAMHDVMMIRHHELVIERPGTSYGGQRAFSIDRHTAAFAFIAHAVPDEVREVWTDALQRLVDRSLTGTITGTANQWASIPAGINNFYAGTGDDRYREWALRHVRWMATGQVNDFGQMPAGYMADNYGPDATYNGLTTGHLSKVYRTTGDEMTRESIRRAYELFNHTIAPDPFAPNDRGVGATNFAHRTTGSWWSPQGLGGGGLLMMADILPEAGFRDGLAWEFPRLPRTPAQQQEAVQNLLGQLRYNPPDFYDRRGGGASRITGGISRYAWLYRHFPTDPKRGQLPMVGDDRFTRNFGDEFFAVRRGPYYALVYAGATMEGWMRSRWPDSPDERFPRNGGGLSMLWTPELGASIIGQNWSSDTAHTLIAVHDGRTRWEDYWSVENDFRVDPDIARVTGSLWELPMRFKKTYRFFEDHIGVELTLTAEEDLTLESFVENFPIRSDDNASIGVTRLDEDGRPTSSARAHGLLLFHLEVREAHLIWFDEPRTVDMRTTTNHSGPSDTAWGCVQAELPRTWSAGEQHTIRYVIRVVDRNNVADDVRDWRP